MRIYFGLKTEVKNLWVDYLQFDISDSNAEESDYICLSWGEEDHSETEDGLAIRAKDISALLNDESVEIDDHLIDSLRNSKFDSIGIYVEEGYEEHKAQDLNVTSITIQVGEESIEPKIRDSYIVDVAYGDTPKSLDGQYMWSVVLGKEN